MTVEQQAGRCLIKLAGCKDGPEKHAAIVQVIKDEIENCGQVADTLYEKGSTFRPNNAIWNQAWGSGVLDVAAAIRKKSK